MEAALRPYFPRVKAIALPQQQALVGLSCLADVGPNLIQMVPQAVAGNPAMSQLRMLRILPGSSYQIVAIGFEQGLAWYNIDTGRIGTMWMDRTYTENYRQACGLTQNLQSIGNSFVFIGRFTATVDTPQGRRTLRVTDSLGVWNTDALFELHRQAEFTSRQTMIGLTMEERGFALIDLRLDSIEKIPINIPR